jgi:RNA polymerase sigma factor (sigma-70 family)
MSSQVPCSAGKISSPEQLDCHLRQIARRTLRRLVQLSKEEEEEEVQEVMARLIEWSRRVGMDFDPGNARGLTGAVVGIARRRASELRREQARRANAVPLQVVVEQAVTTADSEPAAELCDREGEELLGKVFCRLRPRYQRLLWARYVEGRCCKEIAENEGLSVGYCRNLIWRACRAMRKRYWRAAPE